MLDFLFADWGFEFSKINELCWTRWTQRAFALLSRRTRSREGLKDGQQLLWPKKMPHNSILSVV